MASKTPEEILEDARKVIGLESDPVPSRYPVEYDPIRRYCHMVDDDNPLFLDPEYAATTEFGAVVTPPFFVRQTAGPGPWPPRDEETPGVVSQVPAAGDRTINLNTEFECLRPIKVGDHIATKQRVVDVYIKAIRLDPKAFWTVYDTIFTNQDNEVVLIMRNTLLRHRTPEEVKAAGDAPATSS